MNWLEEYLPLIGSYFLILVQFINQIFSAIKVSRNFKIQTGNFKKDLVTVESRIKTSEESYGGKHNELTEKLKELNNIKDEVKKNLDSINNKFKELAYLTDNFIYSNTFRTDEGLALATRVLEIAHKNID